MKKKILYLVTILIIITISAWGQDLSEDMDMSTSNSMDTAFGFTIGTVTLNDLVYNSVRLTPELAFGKLGIGLDVDFRFTFDKDSKGDTEFLVYEEDWYFPDGGTFNQYLNLYLSKFSYMRWGQSRDPLYVKFGSLTGTYLGTGFVMGGYTNTLFLPETRIFGGEMNLDGNLFNFPYVGFSGMVGNVSELDVMGGRFYIRPAAFTDIPILSTLEIGSSVYTDRNAYTYLKDEDDDGYFDVLYIDDSETADTVVISSVDTIIPIFNNDLASLMLMADMVLQGAEDPKTGTMVGLGGNFLFLQYNGQLRFMEDDFQPVYFDRAYDFNRAIKQMVLDNEGEALIDATTAYLGSLGANIMANAIFLNVSIEGPLAAATESAENAPWQYPHIKGVLQLNEGVLNFMDFNFFYDKPAVESFADIADPEGALIGGLVNFYMPPAVITLQIDVKTDPLTEEMTVSSEIRTGIKF